MLVRTAARRLRVATTAPLSALARLRVRGRGSEMAAFRPRFEAAEQRLLALPVGAPSSGPGQANAGAGLEALRAHLRGAERPKFFADAKTIAAGAREISESEPAWRQRTIAAVHRDRDEGLAIYGRPGPLLRPGFPWGSMATGPGGDVLHAVRPHRFAFAPRWALAVLYGEPLAGDFLRLIEDWMRFAAGPGNRLAYLSNLVVIQRVLANSWAWSYLAACEDIDDEQRRLELRLLQILATDIEFLLPKLGSSFPNNHLLVDRFAGWFVAVVWPELVSQPGARDTNERLWLAEWERQTLPDGAGFEHAQHYHEFACEMAVAYLALSRRNGLPIDPRAIARTHAMLRFQADVNGPGGRPLAFGNGTEDPLFPLDAGEAWCGAALQQILVDWFEAVDRPPAPQPSVDLERAFWLLGARASVEPFVCSASSNQPAHAVLYPDGGIAVLAEDQRSGRLVLRTGPAPGGAICAGHAHADLLSVYLDVAGTPLIVDAGTFSYRSARAPWAQGEAAWRRYFAGPAAHNGLTIAGVDPLGSFDGDFRPVALTVSVEVLNCHLEGPLRWVEGTVLGAGPYTGHRRGVIHVVDRYWLIYDLVPPAAGSSASLAFQAAPGADVHDLGNRGIGIDLDGARLRIRAAAGLSAAAVELGKTAPPAGWVSTAYGCKVAAPQLRYGWTGERTVTAFVVTAGARALPDQVEAVEVAGRGCAFRLRFADRVDCLLASDPSVNVPWSAFDMVFHGKLARSSVSGDGHGQLDWVQGHSLQGAGLQVRAREQSGLARLSGRWNAGGFECKDGLQEKIECLQ